MLGRCVRARRRTILLKRITAYPVLGEHMRKFGQTLLGQQRRIDGGAKLVIHATVKNMPRLPTNGSSAMALVMSCCN